MTSTIDISILLKDKKLERYGDITGFLEVTVQGGYLMEQDTSRDAFGFTMDVIGSTRRTTIVNKLVVIFLQHIMTPLFTPLDRFALAVPYLFAV